MHAAECGKDLMLIRNYPEFKDNYWRISCMGFSRPSRVDLSHLM